MEFNIKETDLARIKILGEKIEDMHVASFNFPPPMSVNFAEILPGFLERRLRKSLTSRPDIDRQSCTLCNICVEVCPAEMMSKTGRIIIDYDGCIRCYCCQEMCPQGAISVKEGWLKKIIPGL